MSNIRLHRKCIKHEAVSKTKRMLTKIEKQFGGSYGILHYHISLTGVDDLDNKEIKYCIKSHLEALKKKIEKQLFQNQIYVDGNINEDYEEGFNIAQLSQEMNLIESLEQVSSHIRYNYPELPMKQTDFIFTSITPDEKYSEAKLHFELNPVIGFSQEYYAILDNGETRRLYPATFMSYDLIGAKGVRVTFL